MADVMNIQKLVKAAAAKQAASVDSERNDEHEEDIKAIPANVDSQSVSDAIGVAEKDPAMNIGTKAEATTDESAEDTAKDEDDGQAFKSAADLRKLASQIISGIEAAVEKEASDETAVTVDAPEGGSGKNTEDDSGKEESIEGGEANGESTQTTTSATQTSAPKQETAGDSDPEKDPKEKKANELAAEVYQMAQDFLVGSEELSKQASMEEELTEADVDGLEDSEADELATALQASAMDAASEGAEDADNVVQYLDAYQQAPEDVLEDMADVPEATGGEDGDIEQLLAMLQEAGVSPEELTGMAQKAASTKEAEDDAWKSLNKEAKHKIVLDVLEGLQSK